MFPFLLTSTGNGFWFRHSSNVGGSGTGRAGTAGADLNRVFAGGCLAAASGDIYDPGVQY